MALGHGPRRIWGLGIARHRLALPLPERHSDFARLLSLALRLAAKRAAGPAAKQHGIAPGQHAKANQPRSGKARRRHDGEGHGYHSPIPGPHVFSRKGQLEGPGKQAAPRPGPFSAASLKTLIRSPLGRARPGPRSARGRNRQRRKGFLRDHPPAIMNPQRRPLNYLSVSNIGLSQCLRQGAGPQPVSQLDGCMGGELLLARFVTPHDPTEQIPKSIRSPGILLGGSAAFQVQALSFQDDHPVNMAGIATTPNMPVLENDQGRPYDHSR